MSTTEDSLVMIRPYKALVYHEVDIRNVYNELRKEFGPPSSDDLNSEKQETAPTSSSTGDKVPEGDGEDGPADDKGEKNPDIWCQAAWGVD